jgi:hypothetical protein
MSCVPGPMDSTVNMPGHIRPRPWFRRHPIAGFLGALVLTIMSAPFSEEFSGGTRVEAVLLTVLFLSSFPALRARRGTLIWGAVLITPALIAKWLNHGWSDTVPPEFFLAPGLLFLLFLVGHLLRFILRAKVVDSEVLCAGVAGYLTLGLLWSFAYILVARLVPGSFVFSAGPDTSHAMKGFTALYFSFITLCTVGYGEIVPVAGAARMLAILEAMCGTFYMALLIARLVAMYSVNPPATQPPNASSQGP